MIDQVTPETSTSSHVEIGTGATICLWSDSHAATVVAVSASGKRVTVREDKAKLLNGPATDAPDALTFEAGGFFGHTSGVQRWETTPDPVGRKSSFSLRSNGQWIQIGQPIRGGVRLLIGKRRPHYDFNF